MPSRPLRQNQNAKHDDRGERHRDDRAANGETAVAYRLIKHIAERGAERPGQDECRPEQENV